MVCAIIMLSGYSEKPVMLFKVTLLQGYGNHNTSTDVVKYLLCVLVTRKRHDVCPCKSPMCS